MVLLFRPQEPPPQPLNFLGQYLALLLHFDSLYCFLFYPFYEVLLILKGRGLVYPSGRFAGDEVVLHLMLVLALAKAAIGRRAIKSEQPLRVAGYWLLNLLTTAGAVYFLVLQHYVLKVELAVNGLALCLMGGQLLLGLPLLALTLCG